MKIIIFPASLLPHSKKTTPEQKNKSTSSSSNKGFDEDPFLLLSPPEKPVNRKKGKSLILHKKDYGILGKEAFISGPPMGGIFLSLSGSRLSQV